ncbi:MULTISPECIES: sigma-70 family RNA polymerase sigma factor [unclassified Nocardioides]|uniref:sigma-70 family RNA polymerase sigma factor n=1 Tax=unclassified Nocardioides TaxID=2615069 RepID=UPI0026657170|nr:sigma-70 family RNA polymerase sigma factor [Nocardioides sp. Arc9.136]WKN47217.1 sigma-70 family RNA polymerase sigma factor [Nocardioides sp. Arc9.136]
MTSAHHTTRLPRAERAARTEALLERLRDCADEDRREDLRRELVMVNRGVAEAVAKRYRGRGLADDDLAQVAYLGLTKAVTRFDPDRGHDLLTFAVPTIRGEITRHFRDHGWAVRPPRRVQELQSRFNRTVDDLHQELGREPTDSDIREALGLSREEYDEVAGAWGCFAPRSLDQPVGSDEGAALMDLLPEEGVDDPHAVSEARVALAPVVRSLGERDQRILYLRFFEDRSQAEIGADLGVSQVQVSRLLGKILDRMRAELA